VKIFDSHLHIIDPRYPLVPNSGYLPEPFTCDDYVTRMKDYDLCGGAVVSGSFQGCDQTYLMDALSNLGPSFVGVTNLAASVTDQAIFELNHAGVRAIRCNVKRGGSENIMVLEVMARRVYDLCGWHVELYVDSADLTDLYHTLVNLPAICIDHLGLTKTGFSDLLKLVEKGAYVKASGFGRVDFDVVDTMKQIYSINPGALMFGTDLPSTRATRPYYDDDCNLVIDAFGEDQAKNIFYNNALEFYRPKTLQVV
jgi:predicted TIM-barrel fold metal-dependent hydrolase